MAKEMIYVSPAILMRDMIADKHKLSPEAVKRFVDDFPLLMVEGDIAENGEFTVEALYITDRDTFYKAEPDEEVAWQILS